MAALMLVSTLKAISRSLPPYIIRLTHHQTDEAGNLLATGGTHPLPVALASSGTTLATSSQQATVTPTITVSTTAYTAGDSIGGKITLANAVAVTGGASLLHQIMLLDRSNQKPTGYIFIFGADPTAATITDNAAFVFAADDLKVIAQIPVASGDWITTNGKALADLSSLGRHLKAASGTSLFAAFVTTSTPTFAATTDFQIEFKLLPINS